MGKPGGRSGKFALTFCSATVAASASILAVSSFTLLKFMLVPQLSPASNIKPLSMLPISPSSFSASGSTPPMQLLTERRTPIAGPKFATMSPNSVQVLSLSITWSSARLAFMTNLVILRTSASSVAYMLACAVSCLAYASTSLAKSALSFWLNRSFAWSSFLTCSSSFLIAKSMRGFSGGGGLTAAFKVSVNEFSSLLVSHFLAKRSDKLSSSTAETCGMYLCIINMDETCRYIHESEKPELNYNYPLQNHKVKQEVIDKSMKIPLNCCAIFFYSPPYLKAEHLLSLVCCGVVRSFDGLVS